MIMDFDAGYEVMPILQGINIIFSKRTGPTCGGIQMDLGEAEEPNRPVTH